MSYSSGDVQSVNGAYQSQNYAEQPRPQFELTPEELRIIRECSREGIYQRAIPMGILFGIGGLFGARAGPLMSSKFGVKPAVIGLGLLGYSIGRMSYSKICFQRALQVPDGNLKKMFPNIVKDSELLGPADNYYSSVETQKNPDQTFAKQNSHTDLDIPSMSQFDTVPSDYYAKVEDQKDEYQEMHNYTSYDDLRKQNRQDYHNKLYSPESQRTQPRYPVRRAQDPQSSDGGQKTKYGDSWESV